MGCHILTGCGKQDTTRILMKEPKFVKTEYGQDIFRLSWTRETKEVESYELAFWCQVGERNCRDTKVVAKKKAATEIHLLNGVYTDTVTYQMKVRPVYNSVKKEYGAWSNIWMIDYVDGKYTISEVAKDFDFEPEKKPEETQQTNSTQTADTKADKIVPIEHTYPERLFTYMSKERGQEAIDFSKTKKLIVTCDTCLEGYPSQEITEEAVISDFLDAAASCIVEADYNNISSTGTSYGFFLYDENDTYLGGFPLQDGRIPTRDKRYLLTGANALFVEGIMKVSDWEDYYCKEREKRDEYWNTFQEIYPDNLFHRTGYDQNEFLKKYDELTITAIKIYVDYVGGMKFYTQDADEIATLMEGIFQIKVTGEAEDVDAGHMWHMIIYYMSPQGEDAITFSFWGKTLQSQDDYFLLEGMDEFFRLIDHDCFHYMKRYIEQRRLNPQY